MFVSVLEVVWNHVGRFGNCRGSYESRAWKGVRLELSADRAAMVPRSSQAPAIPICHILGSHALHDSQRGHCSVHRGPDSTHDLCLHNNESFIYFLFHRLAINGLNSKSDQPMRIQKYKNYL